MYRKELLILLGVSIIIAFLASGLLLSQGWRPQWPLKRPELPITETPIKYIKTSVLFDFGNGEIQEHVGIDVPENTTALQFLKTITNQNKLTLKYERGGTTGQEVIITTLGKVENSNESIWRYSINGIKEGENIQTYVIQESDSLEVKFEKE